MTSTVKWFSASKGYGFVVDPDGGEDFFVHFSDIQIEGFKTLKDGQKVSFDIQPDEKSGKPRAKNVCPIE